MHRFCPTFFLSVDIDHHWLFSLVAIITIIILFFDGQSSEWTFCSFVEFIEYFKTLLNLEEAVTLTYIPIKSVKIFYNESILLKNYLHVFCMRFFESTPTNFNGKNKTNKRENLCIFFVSTKSRESRISIFQNSKADLCDKITSQINKSFIKVKQCFDFAVELRKASVIHQWKIVINQKFHFLFKEIDNININDALKLFDDFQAQLTRSIQFFLLILTRGEKSILSRWTERKISKVIRRKTTMNKNEGKTVFLQRKFKWILVGLSRRVLHSLAFIAFKTIGNKTRSKR